MTRFHDETCHRLFFFFFLLKACDVQMHLPESREVLHNTLSCIDGALPSTQCMLGLSLCALRLFKNILTALIYLENLRLYCSCIVALFSLPLKILTGS